MIPIIFILGYLYPAASGNPMSDRQGLVQMNIKGFNLCYTWWWMEMRIQNMPTTIVLQIRKFVWETVQVSHVQIGAYTLTISHETGAWCKAANHSQLTAVSRANMTKNPTKTTQHNLRTVYKYASFIKTYILVSMSLFFYEQDGMKSLCQNSL